MDRAFTQLLASAHRGDADCGAEVSATIYRQLHSLARAIAGGNGNATMSATALVSEAWLRLAAGSPATPIDRRAFAAYAAKVMRSVVIDYARQKKAQKRGGDVRVGSGDASLLLADGDDTFDGLDLDAAMVALTAWDARAARLVELRFFGGMSEQEAADELGVSIATAARDWRVARAWLRRYLAGEACA